MVKHIYIWLGASTRDAGPAHAPAGSSKGGQFVSGSGGGGAAPKHSPMRQENRNLEAKQLKESRQIAKQPVSPGVNPGVRQMQAKSDVEQAKQRIAAKKKPDFAPPSKFHANAVAKAQNRMDRQKLLGGHPIEKTGQYGQKTISQSAIRMARHEVNN